MTTTANLNIMGQVIEIDNLAAVTVSAPIDDGTSTGTFIRAVKFFGGALGVNGAPILEVDIRSQTLTNLEIVTPNLQF